STVDSGNLAGHLLTLCPGLSALVNAPILNPRWIEGLSDTFWILAGAVGEDPPHAVVQFEQALGLAAAARPPTLTGAWFELERLVGHAAALAVRLTGDDVPNADN